MLSAFISSLRTADLRRKIVFTLVMVIDGEQYEAISSGDISGSYTESGGILTATSTEYNRSGGITKDGEPFVTEGDLLVDIIPARPMDSLPFTCDGPTLVLGAGPIAGAQHAVTLTAA